MAARTLGQKVHETCSVAEGATPLSSDAGDRSRTEAFGIGWDVSRRRCATSMMNTCSVQCAWPKKSTIVRFTEQLSAWTGGETTKLLASDVWPLQQCEETGQLT